MLLDRKGINELTTRSWTLPDSYPRTPVKYKKEETATELAEVQRDLANKLSKRESLWNLDGKSPYESLQAVLGGRDVSQTQVEVSLSFLLKNAKRFDEQVLSPGNVPEEILSKYELQYAGEPRTWEFYHVDGRQGYISGINNHNQYQRMLMLKNTLEPIDLDFQRIQLDIYPSDTSKGDNNRISLDWNRVDNTLIINKGTTRLSLSDKIPANLRTASA